MSLVAAPLAGCFYPGPIVAEDVNKPPELRASYPEAGEPLILDLPQKAAFVFVYDANDPLELEFRWTITGFGVQGQAVPVTGDNEQGSQLLVLRDEAYDGRTLSVRVTDSYGAAENFEWPIVVPEVVQ